MHMQQICTLTFIHIPPRKKNYHIQYEPYTTLALLGAMYALSHSHIPRPSNTTQEISAMQNTQLLV
jgi:hypothetical protein